MGDFCQRCEVHPSLHPEWDGDPSEADCRAADMRASSMEAFGRVLIVHHEAGESRG